MAQTLDVAIGSKSFGTHRILDSVRFSAAPGEVLALLAPSGTGKTTTLRIVLGLDTHFDGAIHRPEGPVGSVSQEPRLLPWLSVAANLRLVQPALHTGEIETLLDLAGLPGKATSMPKHLSLGMARRVALARALAVRPSLLVMDEPFASLDAQLGAQLGQRITAHARAIGAIVLLATHDLDQARATADRLLVLHGTSPATLGADLPSNALSAAQLRARFGFLETTTD